MNSINWARVMAQIVYYVTAAPAGRSPTADRSASCVPTGNFGNILAGWAAKRMGLPDRPARRRLEPQRHPHPLPRHRRAWRSDEVVPTLSPSMDIQVSSNLERLLFELLGRDGARSPS